jgi:hypothetical protein
MHDFARKLMDVSRPRHIGREFIDCCRYMLGYANERLPSA